MPASTISCVHRTAKDVPLFPNPFLIILLLACLGFAGPRLSFAAQPIPQTGWTLQFVDSEEILAEDGRGVNAFDGNPATLWHTEWSASSPIHPHEIQIALGASYDISGFRYLPRAKGLNGTIVQYEYYISTDGVTWGAAVATGSFAADQTEKEVLLTTPVTGQYIRLVALSAVNGKPWTAAAELNVLGTLSTGNLPPNGTIDTPATNLTITAGGIVNFTATSIDPDNNIPFTYQWTFSDPAIPNAVIEDPGNIQFNTPGTYTVTYTVTDALGLADPTPATRTVTVNSIATGLIPQTGWSLQFADSEEILAEDGRGVNAFDGNPATLWHTEWSASSPIHPHEIQIALGASYDISGFRYLPRADGLNGTIVQYEFYISTDGISWGTAVAAGSFAADQTEKEVLLTTPVTGQYIRLVALSAVNGKPWTAVAELNLLGNLSTGNLAPNGTIDTPATDTTITAGSTVNFTATSVDPDNNIPLAYQWTFSDPAIPDALIEDPGNIQFNTPGTYTVTYTVTDALGLADPTPATRTVTVNNVASSVIPQTGWSLQFVDSEEILAEDGRGINAFDGNPATLWHTEWSASSPVHPHEIQIALGASYDISGFRYLPRASGLNGTIVQYEFYISTDGITWGTAVATGSFAADQTEKEVFLTTPVTGQYIRLVALSAVNDKPWTSMAELNLLGVTTNVPQWSTHEILLTATNNYTNPYLDVEITVTFNHNPCGIKTVKGFWDGGRTYKVRFTPTCTGTWDYSITNNKADGGLTASGSITSTSPLAGNHGFIRTDGYHFKYDDGTRYFMFGTTAYSMVANAMGGNSWQGTVDYLNSKGINKVRLLLYLWGNTLDVKYVDTQPFTGAKNSPNHDAINLAHWQKFDAIIQYMATKGIVADIIIFSDQDRAYGSTAQDERYTRYAIARFAAYPNVIWDLRNEYQALPVKGIAYWNNIGLIVRNEDPWMSENGRDRPLSIHGHESGTPANGFVGTPWPSHIVAEWNFTFGNKGLNDPDAEAQTSVAINYGYNEPVVQDEYGYTGMFIRDRIGRPIFDRTMNRQSIWSIVTAGGYATMGDGYDASGQNENQSANWGYANWITGDYYNMAQYDDATRLINFWTTKAIEYWLMSPDNTVVQSGTRVYALAETGRQYVFYAAAGGNFTVNLAPGTYDAHRYNPGTGADVLLGTRNGGSVSFTMPDSNDWVVYLKVI